MEEIQNTQPECSVAEGMGNISALGGGAEKSRQLIFPNPIPQYAVVQRDPFLMTMMPSRMTGVRLAVRHLRCHGC